MTFVVLPRLPLPANEDAERLRQKWAESRQRAETEGFWLGVQAAKQPAKKLIQENEDTWVKALDYTELGALW